MFTFVKSKLQLGLRSMVKFSFLILLFFLFSCKKEDLGDFSSPKGRLNYLLNVSKKSGPLKIALIGGSITEGTGATNYLNSYGPKLQNRLSKELKREVQIKNYGIGASTSDFGVFRLNDIIFDDPDIVIIEFAVNDKSIDSVSTLYNHENMFRTLHEYSIPAVSLNLNIESGKTAYSLISQITERHDVLDVRVNLQVGDFSDGTHPNDIGHNRIANCIVDELREIKEEYVEVPYCLPNPIIRYDYDRAIVSIPDLTSVGWKSDGTFYKSYQSHTTKAINDTIDLDFNGNRIGLLMRSRKDEVIQNSRISVQIDDFTPKIYNIQNASFQIVRSPIIEENLENGKHRMRLIFQPIDSTKIVTHELISCLISGYGDVSIDF